MLSFLRLKSVSCVVWCILLYKNWKHPTGQTDRESQLKLFLKLNNFEEEKCWKNKINAESYIYLNSESSQTKKPDIVCTDRLTQIVSTWLAAAPAELVSK